MAIRGAPAGYSGITESWLDSLWVMAATADDLAATAAGQPILEDEATFIDFAHSPLWLNRDHRSIGLKPAQYGKRALVARKQLLDQAQSARQLNLAFGHRKRIANLAWLGDRPVHVTSIPR